MAKLKTNTAEAGYFSSRAIFGVAGTAGASGSYLVQEEDGTSKLTLEEGGGSLLTEESS